MSKGYYKVTLVVTDYTAVDGAYKHVTAEKVMMLRFWDEVQSLLRSIVEGSDGKTAFTIEFIRKEEADE